MRKGLRAAVGIAIMLLLCAPLASAATSLYNFSQAANKHYSQWDTDYQDATAPTWSNGWLALANQGTPPEYTQLTYDDGDPLSVPSTAANKDAVGRFEFLISEDRALIDWVFVRFNGYEGAGEAGYCYVANFTGSSWRSLGTIPTSDSTISANYTSPSDLINTSNGMLGVYCYGDDFDVSANDAYFADLVDVQVGYSPLSCGKTLSGNVVLSQNLSASGTCFTIGANNIVIDGNGTTLTGNGGGYGISNTGGYDNITIKNFAGKTRGSE